jgi:hypothetical protein
MSSDVLDLQTHGTYGGQKRPTHGSAEESLGKESLGRSNRRWRDNIKMDITEIGWDSVDWIDFYQDRESCGLS